MGERGYVICKRCGATVKDAPIPRAHHLLNHGVLTMEQFERVAANAERFTPAAGGRPEGNEHRP